MDKIQKGAIYAFFTLTVPEVLRNHRHSVGVVLRNHPVGKYCVFKQITSPLKRIYQNGKIDSG